MHFAFLRLCATASLRRATREITIADRTANNPWCDENDAEMRQCSGTRTTALVRQQRRFLLSRSIDFLSLDTLALSLLQVRNLHPTGGSLIQSGSDALR